MVYTGNQPNPNPFPYDDFSWPDWWIPNLPQPDTSTGGWTPTTVLTPGGTPPDVDENGNPVFRTEVTDTAPPLETTPSDIGQIDPYLANYLASLPQSQGGTTPNFQTTGWDVTDWGGGGEEGGDPAKFETTAWDTTDPDDPLSKKKLTTGGTSFQTGPMNSLVSTPTGGGGGDRGFPVSIFPIIDKIKQVITGGGGGGGGTGGGGGGSQQPGGQQKQQPGVGKLLAALPMLAAFQGGTTTTPAPYAHLGPHTPVAPVFKPQGRGNPIPSIGQLLAGVR